jgi:hypothetical protein
LDRESSSAEGCSEHTARQEKAHYPQTIHRFVPPVQGSVKVELGGVTQERQAPARHFILIKGFDGTLHLR